MGQSCGAKRKVVPAVLSDPGQEPFVYPFSHLRRGDRVLPFRGSEVGDERFGNLMHHRDDYGIPKLFVRLSVGYPLVSENFSLEPLGIPSAAGTPLGSASGGCVPPAE